MLQHLLDHRAGLAQLKGLQTVQTPDGTEIQYTTLAALDRRVAEVRARIAWFEAAAAGDPLPRLEFW